MLSIQYYPFGCQNGQQNRQHASLRIAPSATPMLSVHAVHFILRSSFQAQYSTARRQLVEFPSEPTRNVLILKAGAPAPSTVGLNAQASCADHPRWPTPGSYHLPGLRQLLDNILSSQDAGA